MVNDKSSNPFFGFTDEDADVVLKRAKAKEKEEREKREEIQTNRDNADNANYLRKQNNDKDVDKKVLDKPDLQLKKNDQPDNNAQIKKGDDNDFKPTNNNSYNVLNNDKKPVEDQILFKDNINNSLGSSGFTGNYDFSGFTSNFDIGEVKLKTSGKNRLGNLIADIAQRFVGIHEEGGNNIVPALQKYAREIGMSTEDGGAWCAKLTSIISHEAAKELGKETGIDIKNLFPSSEGVLDKYDKYAKLGALLSPQYIAKNINNMDTESLKGMEIFFSRETAEGGKGHTGTIINATENGDIYVLEGNLGRDGKTAVRKYNIRTLLEHAGSTDSDGNYGTRFLGFGDPNKVIENKDAALAVYLNNKDNLNGQDYASANNKASQFTIKKTGKEYV